MYVVVQEAKRSQFQELAQLMRDLLDRRRQIMSKTLPRVRGGCGHKAGNVWVKWT